MRDPKLADEMLDQLIFNLTDLPLDAWHLDPEVDTEANTGRRLSRPRWSRRPSRPAS